MSLRQTWMELDTFTKATAIFWSTVLFISLLACGGNSGSDKHSHPDGWEHPSQDATAPDGRYTGNSPLTCSDMVSCQDALGHYEKLSGDPYGWDKDDDGIPCERTACSRAQCNVKRSCSDLDSCSQAFKHLNKCSGDRHGIDGDGNGIPCEENHCTEPAGSYECRIDRDCGDFSTYEAAQDALQKCSGDPYKLDNDDDGVACEQKWSVDCREDPADIDCGDLSTCSEAKAWLHGCDTDWVNIEHNGDGIPCNDGYHSNLCSDQNQ